MLSIAAARRPSTRAGRRRATSILTVALPLAVTLIVGVLTSRGPALTLGLIAGLIVVGLLLLRVEFAAVVFVAVEPFESYAKSLSASSVKLLGALLFVAWLLRALSRGTELRLRHPVVGAAFAMLAVLLAATVLHPNGSEGTAALIRYLSYLGALIVLVDCMRDRLPPRLVAQVFVVSCTAAAIVGLVVYFHGAHRAYGPQGDPNDFAFFLVGALPLALGLQRGARHRRLWAVAAFVLVLGTLATWSRGGLTALGAMLVFALVTRQMRWRVILTTLVLAGLAVLAAFALDPGQFSTSFQRKSYVAQQNVDERLVRWKEAGEMTADHPILGLGPAGFKTNYDRYIDFQPTNVVHVLTAAHEMYLEIACELGLLGLLAFLCVLGFGFAGAWRHARAPDADGALAGGVCAAIVGTAVAAIFLTEQYYLPLWLFAALGAALDPRTARATRPAKAGAATR